MLGGISSEGRGPVQDPRGSQKEVNLNRLVDSYRSKDVAESILKNLDTGSYAVYIIFGGEPKGMIAYKTPEGIIQHRQFTVEDYKKNFLNTKMMYKVTDAVLKNEEVKSYSFRNINGCEETNFLLRSASPGTLFISPRTQGDVWGRKVDYAEPEPGLHESVFYIRYKNTNGELVELGIRYLGENHDIFTSNEVKIEGHPAKGTLLEVLGNYPEEFKFILKPDPTLTQTVPETNRVIPKVDTAVPIPIFAKPAQAIAPVGPPGGKAPSEAKYPVSDIRGDQAFISLNLYPKGSFVVRPSQNPQEGSYIISIRTPTGSDEIKIYKDEVGQFYLNQPTGTQIVKFKSVDDLIDHLKAPANSPLKFYIFLPEKYPLRNVSFESAELILNPLNTPPNGTFLLRPSKNPQLAFCSISLSVPVSLEVPGGVLHFRIGTDDKGHYTFPLEPPKEPLKATKIDDLIDLLIEKKFGFKTFLNLPEP